MQQDADFITADFLYMFRASRDHNQEYKILTRQPPVQVCFVCFLWRCGPTRAMASSFLRFLDHTQRRITVSRTPLDE